jgi:hypothetical protein
MVKEVKHHECEICRESYKTLGEAKTCESKGLAKILPKGTVFDLSWEDPWEDTNSWLLIVSSPPSIQKGSHTQIYHTTNLCLNTYDGYPWKCYKESPKSGNVTVNKKGYLSIGNQPSDSEYEELDNSEIEEICMRDPIFAEHFADITKDTIGNIQ